MPNTDPSQIEVDGIKIDLRNRGLAALLAWLVPGAGHFYQGRYAKGGLYMACILTTYIVGFAIGGAHVVYASWIPGDRRWHYACQLGVGLPAFPAMVEGMRMKNATEFDSDQEGYEDAYRTSPDWSPLFGGWMAPPRRPVREQSADEISAWYARKGAGYEMGTWYTMIAGLLNILVIYDAYSGPLSIPISGRKKKTDDESTESDGKSSTAAADRSPSDSPKAAT
ncbi:DUF6677 family protein [Roseimaritima ulvae]|uniref:DUF6677 domain-containing protein n=1 Tax=Roseimaritima ulvae TaxID=980254 RepID=A0A5B9R2T0_9BACT|nr:DUF6677 family protein [Roseimaritima ulvae]QEG43746.1 hypothetical protein UC8_58000 [Roseimaritima ulvae]